VDSSNTSYPVPLYFVSPGRIDYLVPSAAKSGPAVLTVTSGDGMVTTGIVLLDAVAPGIYTANSSGQGAAAAIALTLHADRSQSAQLTFTCGTQGCIPQPISLGSATDAVYLELYATGIRHVSAFSAVTVQIGSLTLPAQYAGARGQYGGLDQINVLLPRSLAGSGTVTVVATVDDAVQNIAAAANTVTVVIQ
jgi:uncharacterized protein (TIGR03437 family)